jgi:acyl carrier protein
MHNDIRSLCLSAIASFVADENDLKAIEAGEPLIKTASLDSLSLVNLIVALEEETGVPIDTDDLEGVFQNLDSLVRYLTDQKTP